MVFPKLVVHYQLFNMNPVAMTLTKMTVPIELPDLDKIIVPFQSFTRQLTLKPPSSQSSLGIPPFRYSSPSPLLPCSKLSWSLRLLLLFCPFQECSSCKQDITYQFPISWHTQSRHGVRGRSIGSWSSRVNKGGISNTFWCYSFWLWWSWGRLLCRRTVFYCFSL